MTGPVRISPRARSLSRRRPLGASALALVALGGALAACSGSGPGSAPKPAGGGPVIVIDIDDHGLAGLWMANAPNLKGLIANGTLAFSRVVVPTHSNQNNIALLTGQYPDGNDVPANSWLSRAASFAPPLNLAGLELGDYAIWTQNPLLTRGDSLYAAARRAGVTSAYFGELPPFEAGADLVHLSIVGLSFGPFTASAEVGRLLLTQMLKYPPEVANRYVFDGPPGNAESFTHFTLRDAAAFVRATSATNPMPGLMFIWDFIALDGSPTDVTGADGASLIAAVEGYDVALGDLLSALREKNLFGDTNILFTLDHGKVNSTKQVVLGTRGGGDPTKPADGQLAAAVTAMGPSVGITTADYALLNEDGDAQIYARVPNAGTPDGAPLQTAVTRALLKIIQSGAIRGLDTTRTMTADGALGTRRFQDFRASGPNQADILVFPADGWTLNQVDPTNSAPGPFVEHVAHPYGRHGGFSVDELYVPLIMSGPAFKRGALVPHPVEHPQVAATALWALAQTRLETAARGPITAALAGNPAETIDFPDPVSTSREVVLTVSGYGGDPGLASAAATSAVIIDVASLYEEELFDDPALAAAAAPWRALAARGARLDDFWTRTRDWPVTEYEMAVGGLPTFDRAAVAPAESDAAQLVAPALGLLQMPTVSRFVANGAGYQAWRALGPFATTAPTPSDSLFAVAKARGMRTALLGAPDFHAIHIDPLAIDVVSSFPADAPADVATAALQSLLGANTKTLAVVALGGSRAGDRRAPAAAAELTALGDTVTALADLAIASGAVVFVTSRGATPIDDPQADFYGPGTSRHVPFMVIGPNARPAVVSGQPGTSADVPATVLFALGVPTDTDFVNGTWAEGKTVEGIAQPLPAPATAGHALVRLFRLSTAKGSSMAPP
ncbi:MAG TPA: alkaline phosphatase family protein [Polyangia bacterium]